MGPGQHIIGLTVARRGPRHLGAGEASDSITSRHSSEDEACCSTTLASTRKQSPTSFETSHLAKRVPVATEAPG